MESQVETIGPGLLRFNHTISFRAYNATYDDDENDDDLYMIYTYIYRLYIQILVLYYAYLHVIEPGLAVDEHSLHAIRQA